MLEYSEMQKALIRGIIGTQILGRIKDEPIRQELERLTTRLYADTLADDDLEKIQNILELTLPNRCQDCNMEGYRDQAEVLMLTKRMILELG